MTNTSLNNSGLSSVFPAKTATSTQLINNTEVTVPSASLPHGATSTEELYYFMDVPSGIPAQTYDTSVHGAWTIEAT